jgi:hypothetical protein
MGGKILSVAQSVRSYLKCSCQEAVEVQFRGLRARVGSGWKQCLILSRLGALAELRPPSHCGLQSTHLSCR